MRILIVEDDTETISFIKRGFEQDGYLVDTAVNGEDGLLMASTSDYDVIILDRMLPRIDGLSVVRTLRANKNNTPIKNVKTFLIIIYIFLKFLSLFFNYLSTKL